MRIDLRSFIRRYDNVIFDRRARDVYYQGLDFQNVGDWSDGPDGPPDGLGEAARRLVARHLAVDPPEIAETINTVLDAGCGLGAGTEMMAQHYPSALVAGINISQAQARHSAAAVPAARFAVMDATRLAVRSSCIDRIHCVEAAFHFVTRLDFLREAYRVLRPGGRLILTDVLHSRRIPYGVPEENVCAERSDYEKVCRSAGFAIACCIDITNVTLTPYYDFVRTIKRSKFDTFRSAQSAYHFVVLQKPEELTDPCAAPSGAHHGIVDLK